MSNILRKSLPKDGNAIAMQLTPASVAIASPTNTSSISASSTVDITAGASIIRCYAKSQDVFLKWGATAVTSSNFDEVIPAGQIVDLVIPVDPTTQGLLFTTLRVIEQAATATLIIIQK